MRPVDTYFTTLAAAFVRGRLATHPAAVAGHAHLFVTRLEDLSPADLAELRRLGEAVGLRLHRFKQTMGLPRVKRVLGTLRGLAPTDLLDVGSGRGVFLWPLLDAFPDLPVTAIDQDPLRVDGIQAVHAGGITRLRAHHMDVTALDYPAGAFDVVTMLEVLEHIPNARQALAEALRVARRFVVLSVPSRPDDNPQHIHLFSQETLMDMFQTAGAGRVRCDYVLNHLIAVAGTGV